MRQRGSIIGDRRISEFTEPYQLLAGTVKAVAIRIELKTREDSAKLGEVIRVFRAHKKMEVHEARPRGYVQPYLYVREDELHFGKASCAVLPKHLFVVVSDVVVGDSNGFDLRRKLFEPGKVIHPRIARTELVVQNSSGRMDVRLPAPPLRSSIDHGSPSCSARVPIVPLSTREGCDPSL